MIASHATDPLRKELRALRALLPFAPRGVEAALRALPKAGILAPILVEMEAIEREAQQRRHGRVAETACLFPAVCADGPVRGGLFYALASPTRPFHACPIEEAFPKEEAMRWHLQRMGAASLSLLPNPMLTSSRLLSLTGGSAGGAFALAQEASKRGVAVPEDVVVSAAIGPSADGAVLMLVGVSGLEAKVQVLELERPGCRFFYVPASGEAPLRSRTVELIPLEEGTIEALFDATLPKRSFPSRSELFLQVQEAERAFLDQDYPAAKGRWAALADNLQAASVEGADPKRWLHAALASLGAIELHAGRVEEAEAFFAQAEQVDAPLSLFDQDDLRLYVAGAHIDRFAPSQAAAILLPLAEGWRARMAQDPHGEDRKRVWIACLGGLRRLHLLLGEPKRAVEVQEELLRWSPEAERARSLGDLGECLRRAGRLQEARTTLREARGALDAIYLPTYRAQTEAFLFTFEGRRRLDTGEAIDRDELRGLERGLPDRSAARWRLEQLDALARLRLGDPEGEAALLRALDEAPSTFKRWQQALGLLRGARLSPQPASLYEGAAAAFSKLGEASGQHPRLDAARLQLVEDVQAGRDPATAASRLLHFSPY